MSPQQKQRIQIASSTLGKGDRTELLKNGWLYSKIVGEEYCGKFGKTNFRIKIRGTEKCQFACMIYC